MILNHLRKQAKYSDDETKLTTSQSQLHQCLSYIGAKYAETPPAGVCRLAFPLASEVSTFPSHAPFGMISVYQPSIFTLPHTLSFSSRTFVHIPTLLFIPRVISPHAVPVPALMYHVLVSLIFPFTSSCSDGLFVPIPTLQTKVAAVLFELSLTTHNHAPLVAHHISLTTIPY